MAAAGNEHSFHLGDWLVLPAANAVLRGREKRSLEPRMMDVLTFLAARAGSVVSTEQLLLHCWRGTFYGDNPVHKSIAQLRRAFDDNAVTPRYIETIRKRGYRLCAPVLYADGAGTAADVPVGWAEGSPFPGLVPFASEQASVFFGRDRALAKLFEAIERQLRTELHFVLIVGASGSGKSSLLQAGLVPALLRQGGVDGCQALAVASFTPGPGADNLARLAASLLQWRIGERPIFLHSEVADLAETLADDPTALLARVDWAIGRATAHRGAGVKACLALIVDPLEAALGSESREARASDSLWRAMAVLAGSPHIVIVAACRSDCFPAALQEPGFAALAADGGHIDLLAPTAGEIAHMVRRPADAAGLRFGRDEQTQVRLDDALLEAAANRPDALPLLQHALRELHERGSNAKELRFADYRDMGGLDGALARCAEEAFLALPESVRQCLPDLLARMIHIVSEEDVALGRSVRWDELSSGDERRLVRALVDRRLFASQLVVGIPMFGVAHEALWRSWPRASEWVARNRALLRARGRLAPLAARWQREGRRHDFLIPAGAPLQEAEQVLAAMRERLDRGEVALIELSRRRARRRTRLRMATLATVACLALAAIGAAGIAWQAKSTAETERTSAERLVGDILGETSARLRALGRLDVLDDVFGAALGYLARDAGDAEVPRVRLRAEALLKIGEVQIARADTGGAAQSFASAARLIDGALIHEQGDEALWHLRGQCDYWLGYQAYRKHDFERTQQYWTRYREAAGKQLELHPQARDAWMELSYAENNLGTLWLERADPDRAAQAFESSVAAKRRVLADGAADAAIEAELADSLSWLGTADEMRGDLAAANVHYREALEKLSRLHAARADDNTLAHRLAVAHFHVAQLDIARGETGDAVVQIAQAGELLDVLVRLEPANRAWRRDRAYADVQAASLAVLGAIALERGDAHAAAAVAALDDLVAQDPGSIDWTRLSGVALEHQASLARERNDGKAAGAAIARALARLDDLVQRTPDDAMSRTALAQAQLTAAGMAGDNGDDGAARHLAEAAVVTLAPVVAASRDRRILDPWVRTLVAAGRTAEAAAPLRVLDTMHYRHPAFIPYYDLLEGDSDHAR
jgi:DNA-binding winged helix-turn-helix (wHTH) protein